MIDFALRNNPLAEADHARTVVAQHPRRTSTTAQEPERATHVSREGRHPITRDEGGAAQQRLGREDLHDEQRRVSAERSPRDEKSGRDEGGTRRPRKETRTNASRRTADLTCLARRRRRRRKVPPLR